MVSSSRSDSLNGCLVIGSTGSGKTTMLKLLVLNLLEGIGSGTVSRAILRDTSGSLTSVLARTQAPYLDLSQGEASWDIAKDMVEAVRLGIGEELALSIASALIPSTKGLFYSWAQELIAFSLLTLAKEKGNWDLRDLVAFALDTERLSRFLYGVREDLLVNLPHFEERLRMVLREVLVESGDSERCSRRVSIEEWLRDRKILVFSGESRSPLFSAFIAAFTCRSLKGPRIAGKSCVVVDDCESALSEYRSLASLGLCGVRCGVITALSFSSPSALSAVAGELEGRVLSTLPVKLILLSQIEREAAQSTSDLTNGGVTADNLLSTEKDEGVSGYEETDSGYSSFWLSPADVNFVDGN